MDERPRPEEITGRLTTKSAKIRALAQAGYDRTEIRDLLGIGYQHVRNVLTASGISGGLRRHAEAAREPIEVAAAAAPREDTSWEVLLHGGFEFVGEWALEADGDIQLETKAPVASGVYAFVANDVVTYVGLTKSGFRIVEGMKSRPRGRG